MIQVLANKLVKWLESDEAIDKKDTDIYCYGIELMLSNIVGIAVCIAIGLLFCMVVETSIFLLLFIVTRRFTGGYHAKTVGICLLMTTIMIVVVLLLLKYCILPIGICAITGIISFLIVVKWTPVESEEKPLSSSVKKRCKKISLLLISFQNIIGIFLFVLGIEHYKIVYIAMIFVAVSIIISKMIRREHYDKKSGESDC